MDVPLVSMLMSQMSLQNQVDFTLMRNIMDTSDTNANNIVQMLKESSEVKQPPHPYLGGKVDFKA